MDEHGLVVNEEVWLDIGEFFANPGSLLYTTLPLSEVDAATRARLFDSLSPLEALDVAAGDAGAWAEGADGVLLGRTRRSLLWLQTRDTLTNAHRDDEPILITQLLGHKKVWLWPPSDYEKLRLYPPPHSSNSQSQHPQPHVQVPPALEAELGPGDTLYLAPMWFHQLQV